MKITWIALALAACSPATPQIGVGTKDGLTETVRCPNWPREQKLQLPATQVQILEWHDRVRARDREVYKQCAGRRR